MLPIEMNIQVIQEQRRDWIAAAKQRHNVKMALQSQPSLARRMAAPLGRTLMQLGARLLRYGRAKQPTTELYRASTRSIRLN